MIRLTASKARDHFADTLNRVAYRGERIVLYRRGKELAAMVSVVGQIGYRGLAGVAS